LAPTIPKVQISAPAKTMDRSTGEIGGSAFGSGYNNGIALVE
jgi:hypothetical protein